LFGHICGILLLIVAETANAAGRYLEVSYPHGCGWACKGGETAAYDLHWQALARKWDCALLGPWYHQNTQDCGLWCLWGHSGGGIWASLMQTRYPDRIVAIWLRSGTAYADWEKGEITKPEIPEAVYPIPVMCNPGVKESGDKQPNGAWNGTLAMFKAYRAKGAPIGFAPDPPLAGTMLSPENSTTRYFSTSGLPGSIVSGFLPG